MRAFCAVLTTCFILSPLWMVVGCSSGAKAPPKADGQVFRLNPERWSETVNNLNMSEVAR